MNRLTTKIYEITPEFLKNKLSGKNKLRFLKDFFLKNGNGYKTTKVNIFKTYHNIEVNFNFIAPIKIATKAKRKGIESTLLRHSFQLLKKFNKKSNIVVYDVGANYGFLSMVWGKAITKENGLVFSFEPSPTVSAITEQNILNNSLKNVKLYKKAIGKINGYIRLYDGETTSNTLQINNSKPVEVEIISLDNFTIKEEIDRIDLIKIDVDGIELDILNGAEEILRKYRPILIIETNEDRRILDFLRAIDYTILDMKLEHVIDDKHIPHNIFCVDKTTYNNVYGV